MTIRWPSDEKHRPLLAPLRRDDDGNDEKFRVLFNLMEKFIRRPLKLHKHTHTSNPGKTLLIYWRSMCEWVCACLCVEGLQIAVSFNDEIWIMDNGRTWMGRRKDYLFIMRSRIHDICKVSLFRQIHFNHVRRRTDPFCPPPGRDVMSHITPDRSLALACHSSS